MADHTKRTVAEKLAAAKKKHKAYLKEKALKNIVNESKDGQSNNVNSTQPNLPQKFETNQVEGLQAVDQTQSNIFENKEFSDNLENAYEADLPLPQYSMDNNYQASSSLPDPLSFFDNFNYSNVGATFQNIAQPLTSLFNNSNNNKSNEIIENPNQVLIENVNTEIKSSENNMQTDHMLNHQLFSYDKFKTDAIRNTGTEFQTNNSDEPKLEDKLFNEFSDSRRISNTFQNFEIPVTLEAPTEIKNDLKKSDPNITNFNQEIHACESFQENTPFISEVKQDLALFGDESEDKKSCVDLNNGTSEDTSSKLSSSSYTVQNLSEEMKAYVEKEQKFLEHQNFASNNESDQKNAELYSIIEQQNAKCVELVQRLYESEVKYANLATDYRNLEIVKQQIESEMKSQGNFGSANDLSKLRDDLQCHLQTIGMLVAEKTELTTLLQETQTAFRNESSQCIDLQNEIKELKIYNSNIEHELQLLKFERMNLNSSQKEHANMFDKIQKELNEKRSQCEEHELDLLESREKLKAVTEINTNSQKHIEELSSQLSMANIKIQQLTLQESSNLESQLQELLGEKSSYEKQIAMLNEALKTVSKEREESGLQYQQYVEQLNDRIATLVQNLEQKQKENKQLKIQEENRIKHIGDLEKQLQNVQSDNTSYNLQRNNSFLKKELESSAELANSLQNEKEQLNTNLTRALIEKEMIEKELNSCKLSLSQLESTVEQLRGSQPDNAVLLATMESDKVAASRAMSQNNELKKQMEGMSEVMLKVNNDNVQLTEIVTLERRTNKDLLEKLQKTEISFQTLAEAIEIKDKELIHLRDQIEKMSKQIVHQEHLSDRLRHYEAQNNSSNSLQMELQEAKLMIAHLSNELNTLKRNQLNQTNQMNQTTPISQISQINQTDVIDQTDQINQTKEIDQTSRNTQTIIKPSEQELPNTDSIEELKTQLNNLQIRNEELESLLQKVESSEKIKVDSNGNESLDKETAMMHLERKFLRTMEEIARLTEEKQRLEHLVLQLQGETETIGEYVTLYQQQRSILKQRALEKDQQLQQLTNDRETIKANLDRVNNLVKKLIVAKGAIPKELLDQHEHFSKDRSDLCSEHQKIHQEINKFTSNGLNNLDVIDNSNSVIAEEIISLLSEIKSSNLVQPNEEGLHHCPWCSGKLITV